MAPTRPTEPTVDETPDPSCDPPLPQGLAGAEQRSRRSIAFWRRERPAEPREKTAFVLSGGGASGATQVGMLAALAERGVRADFVVGASVGALNAAAYAADPTPAGIERLADLWLGLRGDRVFPRGRLFGPWRFFQSRCSVHPPAGLRSMIGDFLPYEDLEDAAVPVHVVATSIPTGEERWFDRGPAVDILTASASLPGVFPPVSLDGATLIDGGVVNNVPLRRAADLGASRIYVLLASSAESSWPDKPFQMILEAFAAARRGRFARELADIPDHVTTTVITPEPAGAADYADFSRTGALIEAGRVAAASTGPVDTVVAAAAGTTALPVAAPAAGAVTALPAAG